jgi:hypothetical protein
MCHFLALQGSARYEKPLSGAATYIKSQPIAGFRGTADMEFFHQSAYATSNSNRVNLVRCHQHASTHYTAMGGVESKAAFKQAVVALYDGVCGDLGARLDPPLIPPP